MQWCSDSGRWHGFGKAQSLHLAGLKAKTILFISMDDAGKRKLTELGLGQCHPRTASNTGRRVGELGYKRACCTAAGSSL